MNGLTRDKLLRALKDAQPHSVRVRTTDDEVHEVARGAPRTPWKHILSVLEGMPWASVEMLDKRGALLGAPVKNEEAATELENLPKLSSRVSDVGQLAQISNHTASHFASLLAAQTKPALDALVLANKDAHELADLHRTRADQAEARAVAAEDMARRANEKARKVHERLTEILEDMADAKANPPPAEGIAAVVDTTNNVAKAIPEIVKVIQMLGPLAGGIKGMLTGGAPAVAKVAGPALVK